MGDDEVTSPRKTGQERKNRVCPVTFDKPEILSLHVINSYYSNITLLLFFALPE